MYCTSQNVATDSGCVLYTYEQQATRMKSSVLWRELSPPSALPLPSNGTSHCNTTTITTTGAGGSTTCAVKDTDALNSNIALSALDLLQQHYPLQFGPGHLDLTSDATRRALASRPPCRWEVHHICCTIPTANCTGTVPAVATLAGNVGAFSVSSGDVIETGNHADKVSETRAIFPPVMREVNVQMVFDMGHNPAAVSALASRIKEEFAGRNVR
jgi:hypothetical protein